MKQPTRVDVDANADASLADATANPATGLIGALMQAFNGSTWDRVRSGVTAVTSTLTGFLNVLPWAKYDATPTTRTDGQSGPLQADSAGNLKVTDATLKAGEDLPNDVQKVEQRYSYLNIVAGQATTVVKSGVGVLHAIVFNGPATATNTTNVYDNATGAGTIIATPLATAITAPTTVIYDCAFTAGLTIITATANGANMTVIYR